MVYCAQAVSLFADLGKTAICLKAGVHAKDVFTWLNTAFLPISWSRFK